jgi:hypothetical protein
LRAVTRGAAVLLSLLAAVVLVETALAINGRFNYLASSMAVDADAIWALPTGTRLSRAHCFRISPVRCSISNRYLEYQVRFNSRSTATGTNTGT